MVHFAGLKAVGESVAHPFLYFENNLIGSITLYSVMAKYNCKKVRLSIYFLFHIVKYVMHSRQVGICYVHDCCYPVLIIFVEFEGK